MRFKFLYVSWYWNVIKGSTELVGRTSVPTLYANKASFKFQNLNYAAKLPRKIKGERIIDVKLNAF